MLFGLMLFMSFLKSHPCEDIKLLEAEIYTTNYTIVRFNLVSIGILDSWNAERSADADVFASDQS